MHHTVRPTTPKSRLLAILREHHVKATFFVVGRQAAQALPGVINHFERQGREFVSVNELLADKYLGS